MMMMRMMVIFNTSNKIKVIAKSLLAGARRPVLAHKGLGRNRVRRGGH